MQNIQSIHIGLRCEAAELQFPKLFSASCVLQGLQKLEMIRYSRLRTKSEIARMGEASDEEVVVEDALGGGALVGKYDGTMTSSQVFVRLLAQIFTPKLGVCSRQYHSQTIFTTSQLYLISKP
jgi:hypothetical protein